MAFFHPIISAIRAGKDQRPEHRINLSHSNRLYVSEKDRARDCEKVCVDSSATLKLIAFKSPPGSPSGLLPFE